MIKISTYYLLLYHNTTTNKAISPDIPLSPILEIIFPIDSITPNGSLNNKVPRDFVGLDRFDARKEIVNILKEKNLNLIDFTSKDADLEDVFVQLVNNG